jgi:predicted CoA-substrate-specific enzyme activase
LIKNEITSHETGTLYFVPEVKTIIEIGGQDSKIIIIENGVVIDFALNLICAAGTGAFLDAQAQRLKIPIEEFGKLALNSKNPTPVAARCTVFAESDMIHKQQIGHPIEDIVAGLCEGLVRNFLNNVAKGKEIKPPIVFLGGVSENLGMRKAFEKELNQKIIIPPYNTVMGAFGVALLTKEKIREKTKFRGFEVSDKNIKCASFRCKGCPNQCEVIEAKIEGRTMARWGDRCGKWSSSIY